VVSSSFEEACHDPTIISNDKLSNVSNDNLQKYAQFIDLRKLLMATINNGKGCCTVGNNSTDVQGR
jgi:hypothetical protein